MKVPLKWSLNKVYFLNKSGLSAGLTRYESQFLTKRVLDTSPNFD